MLYFSSQWFSLIWWSAVKEGFHCPALNMSHCLAKTESNASALKNISNISGITKAKITSLILYIMPRSHYVTHFKNYLGYIHFTHCTYYQGQKYVTQYITRTTSLKYSNSNDTTFFKCHSLAISYLVNIFACSAFSLSMITNLT